MNANQEGVGVGRPADRHGTSIGRHMVVVHFRQRGLEPWTAVKLAFQLVFLALYCWCARLRSGV